MRNVGKKFPSFSSTTYLPANASSRKDSQVLELFAQAMLLPSSFQKHGAGSSEMLCVSIPTGTKKKTNETVKAFELGKCAELDFDDEDVVDDE